MIRIRLKPGYTSAVLRAVRAKLLEKGFRAEKIKVGDRAIILNPTESSPPLSGVFTEMQIDDFAVSGIVVTEEG